MISEESLILGLSVFSYATMEKKELKLEIPQLDAKCELNSEELHPKCFGLYFRSNLGNVSEARMMFWFRPIAKPS